MTVYLKKTIFANKQGGQKTWKPEKTWNNLEFDNLGKKTWNLRNFENNLEKPGILNRSPGQTWNFVQKPW